MIEIKAGCAKPAALNQRGGMRRAGLHRAGRMARTGTGSTPETPRQHVGACKFILTAGKDRHGEMINTHHKANQCTICRVRKEGRQTITE